MPEHLPEIFLFYVLPIWNVFLLLTVNSRRRYKNVVLVLSLLLNIAGLVMLYNGGIVTDDKTHIRTVRVLSFFILLELFLLIKWNRKTATAATSKDND